MIDDRRAESPLDPRWLGLLAERCADLRGGGARFKDLYIEQRLELRAASSNGEVHLEECRLEGAAARWGSPSRAVLHACTGLSVKSLGQLLARHADSVSIPPMRPLPTSEMDAPRGWSDWAREVISLFGPADSAVRYISRRAAVVRADGWTPIASPPLVRVERGGKQPGALLAVWGNALLGNWLREMVEPESNKLWEPTPGMQMPVLFRNGTAGPLIHELLGHMAESDLVASGASPLSSLMGANICAANVEVVDDPTRFDLAGAFDCDDEGVRAKPVSLVRAGRLDGFLCDREGAGSLRMAPGRGRRAAWSRPPVARLSNLVMTPGESTPEEIEADLDHGLVVTRIAGATVDPVSARTVLRVERGWEVRHGRKRRPLAPCELTGSVVEILAKIDNRLGSDPTADWRLGWCVKDGLPLPTGSETPSVLVQRLEVL